MNSVPRDHRGWLLAHVAAFLPLALGAGVVVGWHLHLPILIQLHPAFVPMQYNTALGFLFCGMGFFLLIRDFFLLSAICALLVTLVGSITLSQYLLGMDFGIDQLFMLHDITVHTSHPGRMAPNTALSFTLSGVALAFGAYRTRSGSGLRPMGMMAALVFALGVVALSGYPFQLETAYGWGRLTHMALHTAVGFVVLSVGLAGWALRHDWQREGALPGWLSLLVSTGGFTTTIALWHAYDSYETKRGLSSSDISALHAHDALLLFGITLSVVLGVAAHYALKARRRAREVGVGAALLERERALLRSLIDAIPDLIFIKDTDLKFMDGNRAFEERTGLSMATIRGKDVFDLYPPQEASGYQESDRQLMAGGRAVKVEEVVEHADGTQKTYDTIKIPFHDHQGGLLGMIGVARDISERKQSEALMEKARREAEAANEAKSRFLAIMSHEIRTPMHTIIGMAELLGETDLTDDQRSMVSVANRASSSLLSLINNILDLSKIEGGQLQLEKTSFSPWELCRDALEILSVRAQERDNRLELTIDPAVPEMVSGDPQRLRQVVLNLLDNALKFTQSGTVSLRLGVADEPQMLLFEIADTGIGIEPAALERIFAPFTQADSSTTRHYGGSGLGLTICRQLVEHMGGHLWVESVPGEGSHFHFTVYLPESKASKADVQDAAAPVEGAGRSMCVLLADDAEDNRLLFQIFLERMLVDLHIAVNGFEALERAQERRYDLIIMDVQMPGMDGLTATQRIREWERERALPPTPIIALTAHAMREVEERAMAAGCDRHLSKPISKVRLREVVEGYRPR